MYIKQYLYDLGKWEVLYIGESTKQDRTIGIYDSMEEADEVLRGCYR